jgi:hypothetical protein
MAVSFKSSKVLSVSVGKIAFRQSIGELLDGKQDDFKANLVKEGYTDDQSTKIVESVLGQVFGFLGGAEKTEEE